MNATYAVSAGTGFGFNIAGLGHIRLNTANEPCAVIKAGVRIFSDGRDPHDGSSLAATRREARAMRRRRDRLLRRKARMMRTLVTHGFFPEEASERKTMETVNPYELRAQGLERALTPMEFGRALFHINQRRGFKSNRKTDKKDSDSGALKKAIHKLREALKADNCATVGQWLHLRDSAGQTVRARYRKTKVLRDDGTTGTVRSYDLYIDRAMIQDEFDALWTRQASLNPALFTETARTDLKDCLLHQRMLKPVEPGRCTFLPEEKRAPLALPSTQRFRIYQEVNHLRILREGLNEKALTLAQRDLLVKALEKNAKRSFTQIKRLLRLGGNVHFNFEDPKREELKGNSTSAILAKDVYFGRAWYKFDEATQDAIVLKLSCEENLSTLIRWLQSETGVDERRAEAIANAGLPEGYGSLSAQALARILPELRRDVVTYDKAVQAAGFAHHSHISPATTGEILRELPYYGEPLQRHVGFGTGKLEDTPEKRFGKIANPTVHIGLNQVRLVVNALIKRYGHPCEVIVELARDLKQSQEQRKEEHELQAKNQRRNESLRAKIAKVLQITPERVKTADIQKVILWEELCLWEQLSSDPAIRQCPYSGEQISVEMLLSDLVEIDHILPFSKTLDDSMNNKTVVLRAANRVKGNRTPWQAFGAQSTAGFDYTDILQRATLMPLQKRYRFAEDGYERWLKNDQGFLARALNDTRYLSRLAREYVSLICPQNTRVIPGRMTAMLRAKFRLNDVLGLNGKKNRNDHRHHAVDACVIGVTDQGLLQRFAEASASTRERQLNRLVENMPRPWPTYREHVQRAVNRIWVSHKPDHSHEGAMHDKTAYALLGNGRVDMHKTIDGVRQLTEKNLKVIELTCAKASERHGLLPNGQPRPYKGYDGNSNYCIEIVRNDKGKWEGEVISTFEAYQLVRLHGPARLRHPTLSIGEKPLVMRLIINDLVRFEHMGINRVVRLAYANSAGTMAFADHKEANVDKRSRAKEFAYIFKTAGSLQKSKGRRVTISPIGELQTRGFRA